MVLAVLQGLEGGGDVLVDSVPFLVGRCRAANLIIPHVAISRSHCEISYENGAWILRDTSTSGTLVNGRLIGKGSEKVIVAGDFVTLGGGEVNLSWTFRPMNAVESSERRIPVIHPTIARDDERVCQSRPTLAPTRSRRRGVEADAEPAVLQVLHPEKPSAASAHSALAENDGGGPGSLSSGTHATCPESSRPSVADAEPDALRNFTELMETELQCTVCSELFVHAVTLGCSHTFCRFCLDQWKRKQKTCPICRKKISTETRSLVVDNYIDRVVEHLPCDLRERRLAVARERKQQEPGSPRKRSSRSRRSRRSSEA